MRPAYRRCPSKISRKRQTNRISFLLVIRLFHVIACEFSRDFLSLCLAKISNAWEAIKLKVIPYDEIPRWLVSRICIAWIRISSFNPRDSHERLGGYQRVGTPDEMVSFLARYKRRVPGGTAKGISQSAVRGQKVKVEVFCFRGCPPTFYFPSSENCDG